MIKVWRSGNSVNAYSLLEITERLDVSTSDLVHQRGGAKGPLDALPAGVHLLNGFGPTG
jgi:hypothetical protein